MKLIHLLSLVIINIFLNILKVTLMYFMRRVEVNIKFSILSQIYVKRNFLIFFILVVGLMKNCADIISDN